MLRAGVSEYPTWIALPLLLPLLFVSSSPRAWSLGTILLGLSFLTRTNQLPAALTTLTLFLWRGWRLRPRAAAVAALAFGALALLPTLHNAYYGHRFVPLTSSVAIPENLLFPPARLRDLAHDADARDQFRTQIVRMLYVGKDRAVQVAAHGLLLIWAAAIGVWVAAGRAGPPLALLICLPLSYLLPQLLYATAHAYPRHFLVGYFAAGAAVLVAGAWWATVPGARLPRGAHRRAARSG
jgi:hypothetical protein